MHLMLVGVLPLLWIPHSLEFQTDILNFYSKLGQHWSGNFLESMYMIQKLCEMANINKSFFFRMCRYFIFDMIDMQCDGIRYLCAFTSYYLCESWWHMHPLILQIIVVLLQMIWCGDVNGICVRNLDVSCIFLAKYPILGI